MPYERCRAALKRYMYLDRVTISRQMPVLDDEGADSFAMTDVYTDVPCKLSQYGKELQSEQRDREYWLRADLRICLEPSYDIRPGDVLIITHEEQVFTLYAAQAFKYLTHQEISVRRDSEA
ncbi:hypothetical protein [uncultured Megasphaera sp.]|uniref:hypothetical protein n=1 Tax=uncultured Megasphaera sp. TaxID=165188 RepID=UPI00265CCE2C|nr:hypothetical protein [uncultured Megasphaera sp.]